MSSGFEIQLIAIIVSASCALPGAFLVLRKMSMICDSITHTILLGIVLAFFVVHDLNSPLLIIGATLMGLLTVYLIEVVARTKIVSEDASIGLIFPLLFSIAIILISKEAGHVHLDTDSVLLGELAFAPFNRVIFGGFDFGPKALYTSAITLIINLTLVILFFKELKIVTFDPLLAATLGIAPVLVHYGLMTSVALTTVVSFEAVGSILVIAFMVGPATTAYLLTDDVKKLLLLSILFSTISSILGYQFAFIFDVSIAGSMALMVGLVFLVSLIVAPKRGLIALYKIRKERKLEFEKTILLLHIYNHQEAADEMAENGLNSITTHLNWEKPKLDRIAESLEDNVMVDHDALHITEKGIKTLKHFTNAILVRYS